MFLRNNKFYRVESNSRNIDLIFYIINFANYNIDNEKCLCKLIDFIFDLYHIIFVIYIEKLYGIKQTNISFETDYKNKKNKKHKDNIIKLISKSIKDKYILSEFENKYEEYCNKNSIYNFSEKHKKQAINNITITFIMALIYYYFHMVTIETLYNECLTIKNVYEVLNIVLLKKTYKNLIINNDLDLYNFMEYIIYFCNKICLDDNKIYSYIRRNILGF